MDYLDPPSVPRCPPSADKPDELLVELHDAQIALVIAEHHIRLWRTNYATMGSIPFSPRLSCVAHEALYEARRAIDRIAELLKIQTIGTLATQHGNSAQIYTEASPMDVACCEPACQPLAE